MKSNPAELTNEPLFSALRSASCTILECNTRRLCSYPLRHEILVRARTLLVLLVQPMSLAHT